MDLNKLTTGDRIVAISAIVFLIAMFLPWYGLDSDFGDANRNGFDYFFFGWIPLLLALAMAVQIALARFTTTEMPKVGSLTWGQVHLILGGLAAVLVLLRLLITDSVSAFGVDLGDLDRKFGLFVAMIAALGLVAGAFLKMQDPADAGAAGGPAAPPPPPAPPTTPPTA
ncbi:MAG: hypothetical protein ACR2IR_01540 [Acidimicrobiia bacterium]